MCNDMGPCCPRWDSGGCMGMCPGLAKPKGEEWDKAEAGFQVFMDEAFTTCSKTKGCCGGNVNAMKASLDADWSMRANKYLAEYGLSCEVTAFYTSDGKGAHPHLIIQFSKK